MGAAEHAAFESVSFGGGPFTAVIMPTNLLTLIFRGDYNCSHVLLEKKTRTKLHHPTRERCRWLRGWLRQQTARDVFGRTQKEGTKYMHFYKAGLDVYTRFLYKDDSLVHFFFKSDEHRQFSGVTFDGIGADSKVDDVLSVHGDPDDSGHSSDYATQSLMYWRLGVVYSFENSELEHITVAAPNEEPENDGMTM